MQIIINFQNVLAPSAEEAKEDMKGEYYNRPHTWASGFSRYLRDGKMIGMRSGANQFVKSLPWEEPDEFWRILWEARREDGVMDDWVSDGDRIGGGYQADILGDRVVWETYHACSGNFAGVRYDTDDGSATLFVDSARHGIPGLAGRFEGKEGEIVLYNSLRNDRPWWESGLKHPDEVRRRKQEEDEKTIPGWKYQELGEEIEARIA